MLLRLFPTTYQRYISLPVLGQVLEGYSSWLLRQGYSVECARLHCQTGTRLARMLTQRGIATLSELTRFQLRDCAPPRARQDCPLAALIHTLERYFVSELSLYQAGPLSPLEKRIETYETYLKKVRDLVPATIKDHLRVAAAFLKHIGYGMNSKGIARLDPQEVESFVHLAGQRLGRAALKNVVWKIRAFLRFLTTVGEAPTGLHERIDTPRLYRFERIPRALPWNTVQDFLSAIDRTSPIGLRDYAMFLLIATYGLRASEVVGLTLDDIEWRARRIRVRQSKTGGILWLPLTDIVGTAILEYLQCGRSVPTMPYRQIFLRSRTPFRPISRTVLNQAVLVWSKRMRLPTQIHGVHCFRHSHAVHLLRLGIPFKIISDLLGHRTLESTWGYLRLAVEDLRDVALNLPPGITVQEVAP